MLIHVFVFLPERHLSNANVIINSSYYLNVNNLSSSIAD